MFRFRFQDHSAPYTLDAGLPDAQRGRWNCRDGTLCLYEISHVIYILINYIVASLAIRGNPYACITILTHFNTSGSPYAMNRRH
jgi:hypothetical protein